MIEGKESISIYVTYLLGIHDDVLRCSADLSGSSLDYGPAHCFSQCPSNGHIRENSENEDS